MPSDWSQDAYSAALRYAATAHNGQTVPGTDLPYVVHAAVVAMEVVAALGHEDGLDGDLAVRCALLHDVLEDTGVTPERLAADFGTKVANGVSALTKSDRFHSRQEKMADSLERIRRQPREVWMVKLADRIANLQPPPKHWHTVDGRIEAYREEAKTILERLGSASPFLAERLREKIDRYPGDGP